jgi:hypothetical protein
MVDITEISASAFEKEDLKADEQRPNLPNLKSFVLCYLFLKRAIDQSRLSNPPDRTHRVSFSPEGITNHPFFFRFFDISSLGGASNHSARYGLFRIWR